MKINESDALNVSKPQSDRLNAGSKSGDSSYAGASPEVAGDGIELKGYANLTSQAQASGSSERAASVERFRALIQSGQYQVDTTALSRVIVSAGVSGW